VQRQGYLNKEGPDWVKRESGQNVSGLRQEHLGEGEPKLVHRKYEENVSESR